MADVTAQLMIEAFPEDLGLRRYKLKVFGRTYRIRTERGCNVTILLVH
jgi:hypothetical protein